MRRYSCRAPVAALGSFSPGTSTKVRTCTSHRCSRALHCGMRVCRWATALVSQQAGKYVQLKGHRRRRFTSVELIG